MAWGSDYVRPGIMGQVPLYINKHILLLLKYWYILAMKEGVFIDSFDNQAVKPKPINYPYDKDLFILL